MLAEQVSSGLIYVRRRSEIVKQYHSKADNYLRRTHCYTIVILILKDYF